MGKKKSGRNKTEKNKIKIAKQLQEQKRLQAHAEEQPNQETKMVCTSAQLIEIATHPSSMSGKCPQQMENANLGNSVSDTAVLMASNGGSVQRAQKISISINGNSDTELKWCKKKTPVLVSKFHSDLLQTDNCLDLETQKKKDANTSKSMPSDSTTGQILQAPLNTGQKKAKKGGKKCQPELKSSTKGAEDKKLLNSQLEIGQTSTKTANKQREVAAVPKTDEDGKKLDPISVSSAKSKDNLLAMNKAGNEISLVPISKDIIEQALQKGTHVALVSYKVGSSEQKNRYLFFLSRNYEESHAPCLTCSSSDATVANHIIFAPKSTSLDDVLPHNLFLWTVDTGKAYRFEPFGVTQTSSSHQAETARHTGIKKQQSAGENPHMHIGNAEQSRHMSYNECPRSRSQPENYQSFDARAQNGVCSMLNPLAAPFIPGAVRARRPNRYDYYHHRGQSTALPPRHTHQRHVCENYNSKIALSQFYEFQN